MLYSRPESGILNQWVAGLLDRLFKPCLLPIAREGKVWTFPLALLSGPVNDAKGCCDFVGPKRLQPVFTWPLICGHAKYPVYENCLSHRMFPPGRIEEWKILTAKPIHTRSLGAVEQAARLGQAHLHHGKMVFPDAADRIRPWLIVNVLRGAARAYRTAGTTFAAIFTGRLPTTSNGMKAGRFVFGLVALDPKTQLRTMRGSARLFREIIRGNGVTAPAEEKTPPLESSVLG